MNDFSQSGHLNLRHLFWLRCVAITGQVVAIAVAWYLLGIRLPLLPMSLVIVFEVIFNGATLVRMARPTQESNGELFGQLCVDLGALTGLLWLSGGTINPFFSLYLPALAIGAAVLPWRLAFALAVFAVMGYILLATQALPLVLDHPENLFDLYRTGNWVNFLISVVLIAWFVARMSRALRRRDAALAEAQQRLLRDERVVALGAQAATIAHEMGSPLSTIALLAEELRESVDHAPALEPFRGDFMLLEQQIALCKAALARLQSRAAAPSRRLLTPWLESFTEQWRLRHPQAGLQLGGIGTMRAVIEDTVAVGQILTILLDNAARASPDHIEFDVCYRAERGTVIVPGDSPFGLIEFRVVDRGPGMPAALRAQIGNSPVRSTQGGAGVGLYLAFVTAARLRGTIQLSDAKAVANTHAAAAATRTGTTPEIGVNTSAGTVAILTLPAMRAEALDE